MSDGFGTAREDEYRNEHNLRIRMERVHADVLRYGAELTRIAKMAETIEKMQGEMNYLLGTQDKRIQGVIPKLVDEGERNTDFRKQAMAILAVLVLLVGWLISLNYIPAKVAAQPLGREAIELPK